MLIKSKKKNKLEKRFKDKNCVITFSSDKYSDDAYVEIFGNDIDVEVGVLSIMIAYLKRGHTTDDLITIINKLKEIM